MAHAGRGDHTAPLLMTAINSQFDLAMILLERGATATTSTVPVPPGSLP